MVRTWILLSVVTSALAFGCGGGGDGVPKLPTIPVEGKLMVDGKPFGPVEIVLTPSPADPKTKKHSPRGKASLEGAFTLSTYKEGDGAPEGAYDVTLVPDVMTMAAIPDVRPAKITIKKSGTKMELSVSLDTQSKNKLVGPKTDDGGGGASLPGVGMPKP